MKHPVYTVYGSVLLVLLGIAQFRGFALTGISQAKHTPRTIRDNPGSSRPSYGYFPHTFGGK